MPPTLGIAAATQGQVTSALERAHEHAAHGLAFTDPVPSLSTSSAKQTLHIQEITEVETSVGELFFLNQTEPLVTNAAGAVLPKSGSSSSTEKGKTTTGSASSSKGNQHQQHIFKHTNFGTNPFNYMMGHTAGVESFSPLPNPMFFNPTSPYPYFQPPYLPPPFGYSYPTYATITTTNPHTSTQLHMAFVPPHTAPPNPPNPPIDPNLPTMRQMKLELPLFCGGDPVEWINKVEQYFAFYEVPDDKKQAIASMHITERAADCWFLFRHEFANSWLGLAELLMREFSGYTVVDYQAALGRMSQTGTVEQSIYAFTKLSRRVSGFSHEALVSCFISGLKEAIRAHVKDQKPKTLYEACELAKVFEELDSSLRTQAQVSTRLAQGVPQRINNWNGGANVNTRPPVVQQRLPAPPNNGPPGRNRRLTQAEYQERRARNQCFFCDEIFRPGHNCRRGQALMVIEVEQEERALEGPEGDNNELALVDDNNEEEVVLQAMSDGSASTMQLKGLCNKKRAHVLIDLGASHNFIHPALLKSVKATVQTISRVRVKLASGAVLYTNKFRNHSRGCFGLNP
ncbi:hypothetical protein ACLB2K_047052 [Fragaria x ananassa]